MSAADTARRLINKFGRHDGEIHRASNSIEQPQNRPWAPVAIAVSPVVATGLSVVVLDAKTALRPEVLLPEQTAVAYLDADVKPKALDVLKSRGLSYSVLQVEELAPGPDTCLYILHLKGG